MGRLTTHVLDAMRGAPGAGMRIELWSAGPERRRLATTTANAEGRTDSPLLTGAAFTPGVYEIVFHAGEYFATVAEPLPAPPFVGEIVVRFGVADAARDWHVPLLVSPWSWTTYRGA